MAKCHRFFLSLQLEIQNMKKIVFCTGRTVQLIAAVLFAKLTTADLMTDVTFKNNIRFLSAKNNDSLKEYEDAEIYIFGDLGDTRVMQSVFSKAKSVTYYYAPSTVSNREKAFLKHISNSQIISGYGQNNLDNVIGHLKHLGVVDKEYVNPLAVEVLLGRSEFTERSVDRIYRSLAVWLTSPVEAADILEFKALSEFSGLVDGGKILELRHEDFVTRALKEQRIIKVNDVANIPTLGTNKQYASCLATEMAKRGNGFGSAYYDTAEHRHFELRATTPEGSQILKFIIGVTNGLGNDKEGRIRVKRDHELASK